jgi:hypothetical protein
MIKFVALSVSLAFVAGSSFASTILWESNLAPTVVGRNDLGPGPQNFKDDSNNFNLVATGLSITNMPTSISLGSMITPTFGTPSPDLADKLDSDGEHGLGVFDVYQDGEIRLSSALQIDLSALSFSGVSLTIDSIDVFDGINEGFRIWGVNGGKLTLLFQGNAANGFVQTVSFNPATFKVFDITSDTPNNSISSVVLRSVEINSTATPEPATMAMMGLGLIAAGAFRFRKKA